MSRVAASGLVASAISASRARAASATGLRPARPGHSARAGACSAAKAAARSSSTRTRSVTSVCTPTKLTSSPRAVEDRADRQLVPEGGAVLAVVQQRHRDGPPAASVPAGCAATASVGRRALQEPAVAADRLLGGVAGDPRERRVDPHQRVARLPGVGDGEADVGGHHRPVAQRLQLRPRRRRSPSDGVDRQEDDQGELVAVGVPAGSRSPRRSAPPGRPPTRTASPATGSPSATRHSGPPVAVQRAGRRRSVTPAAAPHRSVAHRQRDVARQLQRRRCWRRHDLPARRSTTSTATGTSASTRDSSTGVPGADARVTTSCAARTRESCSSSRTCVPAVPGAVSPGVLELGCTRTG